MTNSLDWNTNKYLLHRVLRMILDNQHSLNATYASTLVERMKSAVKNEVQAQMMWDWHCKVNKQIERTKQKIKKCSLKSEVQKWTLQLGNLIYSVTGYEAGGSWKLDVSGILVLILWQSWIVYEQFFYSVRKK